MPVEQEIKLVFADVEAARQAVQTAGGRLVVSRRLLDDTLFDTPDGTLREAGSALRIRHDDTRAILTWKGPLLRGPVKSRQELETAVDDGSTLLSIVRALGFEPRFRGQKYREEYELDGAHIAIDEPPFAVFVEIEASPEIIARTAGRLGRTADDYRLESYATLWRRWCEANGLTPRDMLFDPPPAS